MEGFNSANVEDDVAEDSFETVSTLDMHDDLSPKPIEMAQEAVNDALIIQSSLEGCISEPSKGLEVQVLDKQSISEYVDKITQSANLAMSYIDRYPNTGDGRIDRKAWSVIQQIDGEDASLCLIRLILIVQSERHANIVLSDRFFQQVLVNSWIIYSTEGRSFLYRKYPFKSNLFYKRGDITPHRAIMIVEMLISPLLVFVFSFLKQSRLYA